MTEALPFGPGALVFVAVYVLGLLGIGFYAHKQSCLLYTSPSPRDRSVSRMPSSA